ncbi:MAG: tetratricopeptide repeat protein, partial [Kiritimatiellae bacterium]|nr:tetratricopeptide repeat protein [Kiritimatiellia bacterium]
DNADANFAMGMYYLKEQQLSRAEEYLKRCLLSKPNEPALYNNLAMLQMALGKLDAAKINADKALKLVPDAAAVQDTHKQVYEALAKREAERANAGK